MKGLDRYPDPLKPAHVAKLWTMSTETIVAMCESGELEAFRVRRKWRIYKAAVVAYVEQGRREARETA